MVSVIKTKCPSCGIEDGPCLSENGIAMFHIERKKAAYPTIYEFPDCADCKRLKDAMVDARYDVSSFRPPDPSKSRSRWPKDYQDEMYNLELRANRTKAEHELHLFTIHNDKTYEGRAITNLAIVARGGRLKP